jgi:cystathionine beta-lyase/cystathionine gamma-synthase
MKKQTMLVKEVRGEVTPLADVQRASSFFYSNLKDFEENTNNWQARKTCYGSFGTSTSKRLEKTISKLDEANFAIACSSGMAAISICLQSVLSCGDKILISQGVYPIVKRFALDILRRQNIEVEFFDFKNIKKYKNDNKIKAVYIENPCYGTFEIIDEKSLFSFFSKDVIKIVDNSWASFLYHSPLKNGADIVLYSATKNISGHLDVMSGFITTNSANLHQLLKQTQVLYGNNISPDDCYLVLRGLKTLGIRLHQKNKNASKIAVWLGDSKKVKAIYCPFYILDENYYLYKRFFKGGNGLVSFELKESLSFEKKQAFIENFKLFCLSHGWGGCDSQLVEMKLGKTCRLNNYEITGSLFRLSVGIEDLQDLIADLENAFDLL